MARDLRWGTVSAGAAGRRVALGLVAVVLLAALWSWTPLREGLELGRWSSLVELLRSESWGPLLGTGAFAVAALALVPVTALTAAAVLVYGWPLGFATALAGALIGGSAGYLVGRVLWRDAVRRLAGRRLDGLNRALARRGVLAVALVRVLPVAPFTVVNLVAGASRIGFRDFVLGTLVAMAPGTLLLALAADRMAAAWREPDLSHVGLAASFVALLVGVTIALRRRLAG
jgi:uncharacterized membrane protein YdjX (TVP38/TMEM64 family)